MSFNRSSQKYRSDNYKMREFQFGIENGAVGMFECKHLIKMYPNQLYEAVLCFVCLAGLTTTYMYMEPCLLHVSGFGISETYSCIFMCGSYLTKKAFSLDYTCVFGCK